MHNQNRLMTRRHLRGARTGARKPGAIPASYVPPNGGGGGTRPPNGGGGGGRPQPMPPAYPHGRMGCEIRPPSWYKEGTPGQGCSPGEILQCDAVFPASVAVGMGASGTLTFDVSGGNFQIFKPVGLRFQAIDLDTTEVDHTAGFTTTAITFAGTNYLLSGGALNLAAYGVESEQALSVFHVPELTPGAQDLTMTVQNVDTATDLTLYAWLYGFAKR